MSVVFLTSAILAELAATLSLKAASAGRMRWSGMVVLGYTSSFALLSLALNGGMALGVAYGVRAAVGVALTALLSWPLFGEPLTPTVVLGSVLVIAGVLTIEVGARH